MPGPRVKGKRSSAVQLRAAHVRPLQSGSLLAVRLKAADVTAAVRFRGRIWNPPLRNYGRGRRPRRPAGSCSLKSITSRYILYSFAEFCYNGSIPFIIGHFEGVIL